MKKTLRVLASIAVAAILSTANADQPAAGYAGWEGLTSANHLRGRELCPSDLRHRAVIVVEISGKALKAELIKVSNILEILPKGHGGYPTQSLPARECMVVVSVSGKVTTEAIDEVVKSKDSTAPLYLFDNYKIAFYKDVKLSANPVNSEGKSPFAYVMGGKCTEPIWKGEVGDVVPGALRKAFTDAKNSLNELVEFYGVKEPEHNKAAMKELKKANAKIAKVETQLKAAIKAAKTPEQAEEAQIMFDAIEQYRSDMKMIITAEVKAPAKAYGDMVMLCSKFPAEKSAFKDVEAKVKSSKELADVGKVYAKFLYYSSDNFMCKNAGEAKKIVAELQSYRNKIAKFESSKVPFVKAEVTSLLQELDALIQVIPSKVPEKE